MVNINEKRQILKTKLQLEYWDLIEHAEKLQVFINQAQLSGSNADKLLRETLPLEHYNYLYNMRQQLEAMQKYAECLSHRIRYLQEEIEREENEKLEQFRNGKN